jgi:uncharacterized protein YkwD
MKTKKLTSLVVAAALAAPMSLFAETRNSRRTDMESLAADLARALGANRVELSGRPLRTVARPSAPASIEEAVIAQMNRERGAHGLKPLRMNASLALAAEDRIHDLFAKHYFNHVSPDGMQPFVWAQRRGYAYSVIGENLAAGYPTATRVVDGWMHSPGHRANILGRDFDEVGVAVADGSPVGRYGGPTYVALYGSR